MLVQCHCFGFCFVSGVKWWIHVKSIVTNLLIKGLQALDCHWYCKKGFGISYAMVGLSLLSGYQKCFLIGKKRYSNVGEYVEKLPPQFCNAKFKNEENASFIFDLQSHLSHSPNC